ncbi:MAG: DUF4147 domain-containing protein [bacterium]|nr:DUF4147 domain-containing protein [bacterium]
MIITPYRWIKNADDLGTTPERRDMLKILEAGYDSIETTQVIRTNVRVEEATLRVAGHRFDLSGFKSISIIGFGKGAATAVHTLTEILRDKVTRGVVIDKVAIESDRILSYKGTHPVPSSSNVEASAKVVEVATALTAEDLVLVVVCGGGSSLLCWPESECRQSQCLYEAFLRAGATVHEVNLVRKHISMVKGGGLAKLLYPATVVGLVFSDIVGDRPEEVASGPTYYDSSTIEDAKRILAAYGIREELTLVETVKDKKYFESVTNIVLISNAHALGAMAKIAERLGYRSDIVQEPLYASADDALNALQTRSTDKSVVLAGGEIIVKVTDPGGNGGRCQYLALHALPKLYDSQVFAAVASDGNDNGDIAGAVVDAETDRKIAHYHLEGRDKLLNAYDIISKTNDYVMTGPTEANVSDWYILLTPYIRAK